MAWQIQCKQHFLKQLDTLNNQIESKKTLNWHEDVQMYYWDCMREGKWAEQCFAAEYVWEFMKVVWGYVRFVERGSVIWELCESCLRCEMVKIFFKSRQT